MTRRWLLQECTMGGMCDVTSNRVCWCEVRSSSIGGFQELPLSLVGAANVDDMLKGFGKFDDMLKGFYQRQNVHATQCTLSTSFKTALSSDTEDNLVVRG